jgi:colicin import membrane protein
MKEHCLFGLSGWEIAIIALFGFMIFGPDKLPQVARTIGRAIRQFRSAQEQMNKVIQSEVYDPLKDLEPLTNPFAGFSLEGSKDDAKKRDAAKTTKPAEKTVEKTAAKSADTEEVAETGKTSAGAAASLASKQSKDSKTASPANEKKVSSDALKAALSEESEKAKEKATKNTARKAASTSPASESFAQRRARLEREHAQAKASNAGEGGDAAVVSDANQAKASGDATASAPSTTSGASATPDERKEDGKGV